jgi:hypothetical protein
MYNVVDDKTEIVIYRINEDSKELEDRKHDVSETGSVSVLK